MAKRLRTITIDNNCRDLSILTDTLNMNDVEYQLALKFNGVSWFCSFYAKSSVYKKVLRRLELFGISFRR